MAELILMEVQLEEEQDQKELNYQQESEVEVLQEKLT
jgi:hypothetical protein